MKISVVIPTYNRRAQAFLAIDSVLAQTVAVDDILVVDDGSTDGTSKAICSHYGSSVRVVRQDNAGVSAARNRGIRAAKGEWVAFLDSDDLWFPSKIERQVEAITTLGSQFGLCFTDNTFGGNPEMTRSVFEEAGFENAPAVGALEDPVERLLAGKEPFFTSSILVLRSLAQEVGGFDETLLIREDTDFFFRLSFRTRFCFSSEPLVEVDRTPSRSLGLCNSYASRDDRMFDCLERLYSKWLAMPELAGTEFEPPARELLRETCYNSTESKLHQLRIGPALREIGRLRKMEHGYAPVAGALLMRKFAKLRAGRGVQKDRDREKPGGYGLDPA